MGSERKLRNLVLSTEGYGRGKTLSYEVTECKKWERTDWRGRKTGVGDRNSNSGVGRWLRSGGGAGCRDGRDGGEN